jgi:antitoxin VapB
LRKVFVEGTRRKSRFRGAGIIEPSVRYWRWLERIADELDEDFAAAAVEQPIEQQRPALNYFE